MSAEIHLPGSGYEELCNIIVAYGTRDEASNPGDVGKLDAAHHGSVSRNKAFLTDIGVLRGEGEKLVTGEGRQLAQALSRADRAEAGRCWRGLVARNEFLQNVVSAVKMRGEFGREALQAYIAQSAGQPKNNPVMAGAGGIVDLLKAAGLLSEEAGVVEAAGEGPQVGEPEIEVRGEAGGHTVSVHIHLNCTPDELEGLAPRIKKLFSELSETG